MARVMPVLPDEGFFFFQAEDGIRDRNVTGVQDVCSSDLAEEASQSPASDPQPPRPATPANAPTSVRPWRDQTSPCCTPESSVIRPAVRKLSASDQTSRSEERRVGKECRSRGRQSQ